MSSSCESVQPTLCGCCQGITTETPEPIENRAGLSAIRYRVGTHNTFLTSLLASLSSSTIPPWAPLSADNSDPSLASFNPAVALAPLRTRDTSDFSIALLDSWATSLDILTFYQERIANEFFLRTAADTASVFDLAQLVGYRPSPGVAASVYLAFTLNNAPGSPDNVLISAGTRVQSVPGPGQQAQIFETSSNITALIEKNAIPPQRTIPWAINAGMTSLWIKGMANSISAGDAILFVSEAVYTRAVSGSATGTLAAELHTVTAATTNPSSGNTLLQWDTALAWPIADDDTAHLYVLRKKAALFGVQAPDPRTLSTTGNHIGNLKGFPTGGNGDWSFKYGGGHKIHLDASYPGTAPHSGQPAWAVLMSPSYMALFQITAAAETGPVLYTLTTKTTQITLAHVLKLKPTSGSATATEILNTIVSETRSASAYIQSSELAIVDPPYSAGAVYDSVYACQPGLLMPVAGNSLEIETTLQLAKGQPAAVFGNRLRLQVAAGFSAAADSEAGFAPNGSTTGLPVTAGQQFLIDAYPPAAISGSTDMLWSVITTDGVAGDLTIASKYVVLVAADTKNDPVVGETTLLSDLPIADGPLVTLKFTEALIRIYDRSTVTVNANAVGATNGETMYEILGSGDASNPALEFKLKQSPLTYVSSSLNNGAVSTLQVWVNNLHWHEVGNFLNSSAADRVFITQADYAGKLTVQFGDGQQGERTPTGQMNIRAVYRKGIGAGGNVNAGQLSQAIDRPQGLKSVSNPDAAKGGADPDSANDARARAPLHVLTLGRVVSLEDYQNYALAFGGIAKAVATWTWVGWHRTVFLTVAGDNGVVYRETDPTIDNLLTAFQSVGIPHVPVYIPSPSCNMVLFEAGATIRVDSTNYDSTQVKAAVWQALLTAFSFAQRQIGQGVAQSEILAVIQQVPGVVAAEVTVFNVQGQAPVSPLPAILLASSPITGDQGEPAAAQMLLIDPASQGNLVVNA
jgi:hypothetical protein